MIFILKNKINNVYGGLQMRLFKQYGYYLTKNDTEQIIFNRILDLIKYTNPQNTLFYLQDMGKEFKSAIERIIKLNPSIRSHEFYNKEKWSDELRCLSNFSSEWAEGNTEISNDEVSLEY